MILKKKDIKEIKEMFLDACRVDSPSREEGPMIDWLKKNTKQFRIKPIIDNKKNFFFKISGVGDPLLLNAHIDRVPPCVGIEPVFDGENFYSKGDTILGGDDLAGVVSILKTISFLKENKIEHRPLEVLFTTMEEIGGVGIKNFDFSMVTAKEGIVVDSLLPVGSLTLQSPTKYNFSICFRGNAVHGQGADKGLSAIKMMAELIAKLPIGEVKKGLTLNIGTLKGGKSLNTVPGEANITGAFKIYSEGEIRSDHKEEANKLISLINDKIKSVHKKYPKGEIIFDYQLNRPGYSFNSDDVYLKNICKAIRQTGLQAKGKASLGVSDANTLNAMGLKAVLIGTGVKNAHTVNETVSLESLKNLTEIVIEVSKS